MKIGIVCYPSVGGSGVVATELGHELALRGHEVHFITYEVPFRLRTEERNIFFHQVEINRYDLFKYPAYALPLAVKIAAVSKEFQLDIVHAHYAIPHATSAYLAGQILGAKRPKVITTLHGTDITLVGKDPAYFEIVKFSIEQSDAITCVSQNLCNQTRNSFGIQKEIDVIYNFFIPQKKCCDKKPLRSKFVDGKEKLLVHASNFRDVKRPADVLAIFQKVRRSVPSKLMLVGTGKGLDPIKGMVQEAGLENEVIFVGKNIRIDSFVASADLFLLPSSQESFGLAALEAMAYGVPVIASNVGGLPELIQDGENGYLFPVGAVESMAEAAIKLLKSPRLYADFSASAKRRANASFSVNAILPQYIALYQRTMR